MFTPRNCLFGSSGFDTREFVEELRTNYFLDGDAKYISYDKKNANIQKI